MSRAEDTPRGWFARRVRCALFGAVVGGILGLVLAAALQANLFHGVLLGALAAAVVAFAFGLDGLEVLAQLWP